MKQKGLGDTVAAVTRATGIEAIVKRLPQKVVAAPRDKK